MTNAAPIRSDRTNQARPWVAVAMLGMLYVLSFADRVLLSLLVGPLTRDLGVSPVELGLLFGFGFVLVYSVAGIPLAHWLDVRSRKFIVTGGVAIWSLATIASGFAQDITHLFVLRAGLAFGEAVLTPAAISMIADLFPHDRRNVPTATYMTMGTIGAAGGSAIGGLALQYATGIGEAAGMEPWRITFVLMGLLSLFAGGLFVAIVREPDRLEQQSILPRATLGDCVRFLADRPGFFGGMFLAVGFLLLVLQSAQVWMVRVLELEHGIVAAQAGYLIGMVCAPAAIAGSFSLPLIARRLGGHPAAVIAALFAALAATAPFALAVTNGLPFLLAGMGLAMFGQAGAIATAAVAIQNLVPPTMHARVTAILLLTVNLLSLGAGPTILGATIDNAPSGHPVSSSIALVASISLLCAMASLLLAWLFRMQDRRATVDQEQSRCEIRFGTRNRNDL